MKGSISNYENTFFLNETALSGVISFEGSYSLNVQPINVIGKGYVKQVLAEIPLANISLSRYLINQDPILNLTGDGFNSIATSCSGGLVYNGKSFGFGTGFLSSFGVSCSVGEVPQIQSSFDVYGNMGSGINTSGNVNAGGVFVPQVKNITIVCNQSTTNRIKSFTIDFKCPKDPIYGLSSSSAEIPIEVHNKYPIEVTTSFIYEIDDYETKRVFDILSNDSNNSLQVRISGYVFDDLLLATHDDVLITTFDDDTILVYEGEDGAVPIFNFISNDSYLISEQISSSSDDFLGVKSIYRSYLN